MLLFLSFNWPKIKKITLPVLFLIPLLGGKKELEKEREIKQLSKQINPTFPKAFDLWQCQSRLFFFPPFLSLNQYNL